MVRKKPDADLVYDVERKPYIGEDIEDNDSQLNPSISREGLTVVKGVGSLVAQRLNEANVISVSDLAHSTPEDLSDIKGIGPSSAQKMIEEAKSHLRTKKLNDFSADPEQSIMEENTEEMSVGTQLKSNFNEFNETVNKPEAILEPEIYGVEDNDQIEDRVDYEEIEEEQFSEFEEEDIDEQVVHSELDVVEEDVDYREPIIDESQTDPQDSVSTTFEAESFNEQKELPVPTPIHHSSKEIIPSEELQQLETKVRRELEGNGFHIIEKATQLQNVISKIDILAVKFVTSFNYGKRKDNSLTDLLLIIPIKISNLKGSLIVSVDNMEYSTTQEESDFYIKRLPMSFIEALSTTEEAIRANLLEETTLLELFNNKLSLAKTFTKKNLYFYSGSNQYEILIDSLVISQDKVGFTEKILPFAYHKNSNTHVIQLEQLSDFLEYIEKKYMLIESCIEKKGLLELHCEAESKLQKVLRYISIPFASYALVYIFILFIFQAYSLLSVVNNIAFGLIAFMSILVVGLLIFYSKNILGIKREFSTPYHKRDLHLDETNLRLINENLTSTLMEQFSYECLGKNPGFKIIEKVERENSQNFLQNKTLRKKVSETTLFEEENTPEIENQSTSKVKNEYNRKYSSFLED